MGLEYSVQSVVEKCRAIGMVGNEVWDTEKLYWFAWEQYTRNIKPNRGVLARMIYEESRAQEAYKMCQIRIQRIVDLWHEEPRTPIHEDVRRNYQ